MNQNRILLRQLQNLAGARFCDQGARAKCGEDDVAEELYGKVLEVAAGAKSRPEALGHREFFLGYKHFDAGGCGK